MTFSTERGKTRLGAGRLHWFPRCGAAVLCLGLCAGCGYSQDEWQAQMARYSELDSQHKQQYTELQQTKAELGTAQNKVATLSEELTKMGVDVETLNRKLL